MLEQALAALAPSAGAAETLEQAIDLHFDLAASRYLLGQLERGLEHLRDAEALARMLGDQRRLGWVSVYMCEHLWVTGDSRESRVRSGRPAIAETM